MRQSKLQKLVIVGVITASVAIIVDSYCSFNKEIDVVEESLAVLDAEVREQNNLMGELLQVQEDLKRDRDKELEEQKHQRELALIKQAIKDTSSYVTDIKAEQLAEIIDYVATDMESQYGFKKDVARILAMISTETDFRNLSANEAEAVGYMQITPVCLEHINRITGWEYTMDDMIVAEANIRVGWYRYNMDLGQYGEEKAIVAYNQGYNNMSGAVIASYEDPNSYLCKVIYRTDKYKKLMEG